MKKFIVLIGLVLLTLPELSAAQADPCMYVPGGCPADNILLTNFIPTLAALLLRLAGGFTVIFIIWASLQMVLAEGDEGKLKTARYSILYALLGITVVILSQMAVSFVVTEGSVVSQIGPIDFDIALMATAVRIMVQVFNIVMAVMIFLAGVRMLAARGKMDEFDTARRMVIWTILAALIANAAHFAVQAVVGTFL